MESYDSTMKRPRIILISLASGVIVSAFFAYQQVQSNGPGGASASIKWLLISMVGLALVLLAAVMIRHRGGLFGRDKGAVRGKAALADQFGFSYEAKGDTDFRRSFSDVPGIPDSGRARHVMRGTLAGRSAIIFEHMYMVYNGSTMMPMHHTVYSTEAPDWPTLTVKPRSMLARLALWLGWTSGFLLEDAEFNKRFRVKTEDEDFALMLLTPEMQSLLSDKPGVTWHVSPGRMCLVYNGPLRMKRMDRSIERVERFWSLVPEELEEWEV